MNFETIALFIAIIDEYNSPFMEEYDKKLYINVFKKIIKSLKEMRIEEMEINAQYAILKNAMYMDGYFSIAVSKLSSTISKYIELFA